MADQIDNTVAQPIVDFINLPIDQIRIFLIFLIQYPIGWIMHFFIRGTTLRHLYATTIGIAFQLYCYRWDVKHVVLMSVVAYLMMAVLPRQKQANFVMAWVLGYLSYSHICSILFTFGQYKLDITTYTMLLVCKLSALAFCYKDGDSASRDFITKDQKERMVTKMPTILEFTSYVFYCQACALGVFFEFSHYKRFIE